jgi:hypothetical protein
LSLPSRALPDAIHFFLILKLTGKTDVILIYPASRFVLFSLALYDCEEAMDTGARITDCGAHQTQK